MKCRSIEERIGRGFMILRGKRHNVLLLGLALVAAFGASGCGYSLQSSHSEFLERENIHSIYVKPLVNNTFKPGIENVVYNSLIRTLLSHRRVKLVQDEQSADAVLQGNVTAAIYSVAGSTTANSLYPSSALTNPYIANSLPNTSVAFIYQATLNCDFTLSRRFVPPGKRRLLWTSPFSRTKTFSAANQLDVPGATSALINESEFERALNELSVSMMDDVHEFMLAMF
jgi:hypothetical protein